MKTLSQDSWSPDWDSNWALPPRTQVTSMAAMLILSVHWLYWKSLVYLDKAGAEGNYIYDTRESLFISHRVTYGSSVYIQMEIIICCNWKERWPEFKTYLERINQPKILRLSNSRRTSWLQNIRCFYEYQALRIKNKQNTLLRMNHLITVTWLTSEPCQLIKPNTRRCMINLIVDRVCSTNRSEQDVMANKDKSVTHIKTTGSSITWI
jgi:hypothetical protein